VLSQQSTESKKLVTPAAPKPLFVGSGGPPVVEVAFSEDDFEVDAMGAKLGGDICPSSSLSAMRAGC
jgi:hypothetical protein